MNRKLFDPTEGPAILRFPGADDTTKEPTETGSVTLEEIEALYGAADAAEWPKLKGRERTGWEHLKPADWWRCWLCLYWHYGLQTQDVAGFQSRRHDGLLWESVSGDADCPDPQFPGLRCPNGWLRWRPGRSYHQLTLPMTEIVSKHLDVFRGLHPERVFPNGRSAAHFKAAFSAIRDAAGLGPEVTIADSGEREGIARRSIRNGSRDAWDRLKPGLGAWVQGTARIYSERVHRDAVGTIARLIDELPVPRAFHDVLRRPTRAAVPPKPERQVPATEGSGDRLRDIMLNGVLAAKLRSARPATRRHYDVNLRHFDDYLGRPATVDDLTDTTVTDCMWWLYADGERAARTVNKFRDMMLALWRLLHRKGLVDRYPDVDPLPEPERTPIAWSKDELRKLWDACQAQEGYIGDIPARHWWHCLHALLWDTGERITAIISLEWIDVDLDAGYIRCRAENRKGGRQDRGYSLHPDTVEALRAIHQPECRHVLEWPHGRTYLWPKYGKLLESAGLPNDRQHKFHCVRKSVASYFEAAGGNATELLGHSSRSVTRKYIDPKISRPPQAVDLLFRPDAAAGN